jgi:hypothetical protein
MSLIDLRQNRFSLILTLLPFRAFLTSEPKDLIWLKSTTSLIDGLVFLGAFRTIWLLGPFLPACHSKNTRFKPWAFCVSSPTL